MYFLLNLVDELDVSAILTPAQAKINEAWGLRRFLLRCLEKVDGDWHLIVATHNLHRLRRSHQQALAGAAGDQSPTIGGH